MSFGYMSSFEDAKKFINFIKSAFVCISEAKPISFPCEGVKREASRYWLRSIIVYPIKSCAGFRVHSWPLSRSGLLHDREWLLKSLNGEILTQKKVPEMCFISTYIDLKLGLLLVESPRCQTKLQIKLEADSYAGRDEFDVYAQRYEVHGYDTEVNTWFSKAVGRPCVLLQSSGSKNCVCLNNGPREGVCRDVGTRLNFVNEAQFLLISEESLSDLNRRLNSNVQEDHHGQLTEIDPMRFRPNLVISGGPPYAEDKWRSLKIGNKIFMSLGGCNRCQMINLSPQEGRMIKSREPLATLASYRRVKGKIFFGILLRYDYVDEAGEQVNSWLQIGQEILPETD